MWHPVAHLSLRACPAACSCTEYGIECLVLDTIDGRLDAGRSDACI
jgi:hypothetical protein